MLDTFALHKTLIFRFQLTQSRVESAVSSANCLSLTSSSPAGCFFVANEGRVLVFDADSGKEESAVEIPEAAGSSNLFSTDTSVTVLPRYGKRRPPGAVVLQFL